MKLINLKLHIFSVIVIGFFMLLASGSVDEDEKLAPDSTQMMDRVYIVSQGYVRPRLISPSTASFPPLDYRCKYFPEENVYFIFGNVDAQNGFGAMIRHQYHMKLKYNGGEWTESKNWEEIEFGMD